MGTPDDKLWTRLCSRQGYAQDKFAMKGEENCINFFVSVDVLSQNVQFHISSLCSFVFEQGV